jgi:hypothetical protein
MPSSLAARQIGRIAFGVVLLVGLAWLLVGATKLSFRCSQDTPLDAAAILTLTWVAAFVVGGIAQLAARRTRLDPATLLTRSLVIPTLGVALVLPITLHMPFALLIGGLDGFDFWVEVSVWITGLAHLVFAWMCAVRAYQLAAGRPAWSPRRIYVVTLIVSCVPFVVLWAVPPVLVAVTALPFIPMLRWLAAVAERERAELGSGPFALPRAVVMGSPPSV